MVNFSESIARIPIPSKFKQDILPLIKRNAGTKTVFYLNALLVDF
jgi:hypothetical protein